MTDLRTTLADLVSELVDPFNHYETIHLRPAVPGGAPRQALRVHKVRFPSLLDQLAMAVEPSSGAGVARGYESSPSARLEALDMLIVIGEGVRRYITGDNLSHGDNLVQSLHFIADHGWLSGDMSSRLIRDLTSWVTCARVITAWDVPPRRLRAACPRCETSGSLRVRTDPVQGCCVNCNATWDEKTVGILAQIIAAETEVVTVIERPIIAINPNHARGAATINGITVDEIGCALLAGASIDEVRLTYVLTRADVIVACWYLGRHSRPWRRMLGDWSNRVDAAICKPEPRYDRIPDPPVVRIVTSASVSEGAAA